MGTAVLAVRVVLAGVFIVAGVGKLLDLSASRRAVRDFGVSESLAGAVGTLLPIAELAVAVALLIAPTAILGAIGALVLLVAFIAGIANALAHGKAPDCNCFGTAHSTPVGTRQIVRNVVLALGAGFVAVEGPGPTINGWVAARGASDVVAVALGVVALGLLALVLNFWHERQRLQTELDRVGPIASSIPPGLPIGSPAPDFTIRGVDGATVALEEFRLRGKPVALIFGVPGCGPCASLAPELRRWQEALAESLTVAGIGIDLYLRYEERQALTHATLHEIYESDRDLARQVDELNLVLESYRLHATPAAVIITPEGTIASATVDGWLAIEALLRLAAARRGVPGLSVGGSEREMTNDRVTPLA